MIAFFQKITDVLNESNIPYMLSGSVAKRRSLFNIIDHASGFKADFVVLKNEPFRQEEFNRRKKIDFFDKTIYVVSPEDLLISKVIWIQDYQSAQQAEDIKNLTAIENMDWSYIKKWISKLNLKTFDLLPS